MISKRNFLEIKKGAQYMIGTLGDLIESADSKKEDVVRKKIALLKEDFARLQVILRRL